MDLDEHVAPATGPQSASADGAPAGDGASGDTRPLTGAERALVRSVFGSAIDLDPVTIRRRKWWPLQPRRIVMAPRGHIHFHPESRNCLNCFAEGNSDLQGLFIHEMTHVWQHQRGVNLLLRRHPFCRYDYAFVPGKPFHRYGIEQQAEIIRHVFMMRRGHRFSGKPPLDELEAILPF